MPAPASQSGTKSPPTRSGQGGHAEQPETYREDDDRMHGLPEYVTGRRFDHPAWRGRLH
jgi:hypothetical protein